MSSILGFTKIVRKLCQFTSCMKCMKNVRTCIHILCMYVSNTSFNLYLQIIGDKVHFNFPLNIYMFMTALGNQEPLGVKVSKY